VACSLAARVRCVLCRRRRCCRACRSGREQRQPVQRLREADARPHRWLAPQLGVAPSAEGAQAGRTARHGMSWHGMSALRHPPGMMHTRLRRQRDACLSAAIQQHDDTVCRCCAWQNFTFIEHQLSAYSGTQGAVSGLRWSQQVKIKPLIMIEPLCVQLPRHSGSIAV
jgi:hypothetical protein